MCFSVFVYSQKNRHEILNLLGLRDSSLYIVARGTTTKNKLIADICNISDRNITHVGLGTFINNKLSIYNVTDGKISNNSALSIDSLDSFIAGPNVYYLEVWKCNTTLIEFRHALVILDSFSKKKIYFDNYFSIADDNMLYCSEFCVKVLSAINNVVYFFQPKLISIKDPFIKIFLKRERLIYYPVDFFTENKNFSKVNEFFFNNVNH